MTDLHFTEMCRKCISKSLTVVISKRGVRSEKLSFFTSELFDSIEISMDDFTIFLESSPRANYPAYVLFRPWFSTIFFRLIFIDCYLFN